MCNLISPYRCLFCESGSVVLVFVHFYLFSIVAYAIRHRQTDALRVRECEASDTKSGSSVKCVDLYNN